MATDKLVDFDHVTDHISREAAKQRIRDSFSDLAHRCEINAILNSIPAADVVEVVRCKDCINWNGNDCITMYGLYAPRPDDYCSRGEKNSG